MEYNGDIYLQISGSAMGVISSVACGNAYLLYCERRVLVVWKKNIELYKRFLDDVALAWKGSTTELVLFRRDLDKEIPGIHFEWQKYPSIADALDPDKCRKELHQDMHFMDVSVRVVKGRFGKHFVIRNYEKPSNRFSYLPFKSFHTVSCRLGWLKGEAIRLMINSSTLAIWKEQMETFSSRVMARGHKFKEIRKGIRDVRYSQRAEILRKLYEEPNVVMQEKKLKKDIFYKKYNGCVFSIRQVPGLKRFEGSITPDLSMLQLSCFDGNIFPSKAFLAKTKPMSLGARIKSWAAKTKAKRAKEAAKDISQ